MDGVLARRIQLAGRSSEPEAARNQEVMDMIGVSFFGDGVDTRESLLQACAERPSLGA